MSLDCLVTSFEFKQLFNLSSHRIVFPHGLKLSPNIVKKVPKWVQILLFFVTFSLLMLLILQFLVFLLQFSFVWILVRHSFQLVLYFFALLLLLVKLDGVLFLRNPNLIFFLFGIKHFCFWRFKNLLQPIVQPFVTAFLEFVITLKLIVMFCIQNLML